MSKNFRGNINLKRKNVPHDWTPELMAEYIRCRDDVFYFIEKYYKIVTEDGILKMELRDYQKEMIASMVDNRYTLAVMARQCGKTECFRAFLIHYILFNDFKTVGVVANKESAANEIIGKLQLSYQYLPKWLQLGVIEFNKGSFVLENQSRIFASATSKDALRGYTVHVLIIDEAAFIEDWEEFYGAVGPTVSAGKRTKVIMVSTPNGLNHFYDFYEGSSLRAKSNGYTSLFVTWDKVPGRDEKWKEEELARMNFNYAKFDQEYNCLFQGSSGTLIAGGKLQALINEARDPISTSREGIKFYSYPQRDEKDEYNATLLKKAHLYAATVDVSRGKGLDYSTISVFDITQIPYVEVCTFRSNELTVTDFTQIVHNVCKLYNNALLLPEINDIGEQVGTMLIEEFDYENLLCTAPNGRNGKKITHVTAKSDRGVRTTLPLKNSGCLLLKLLLEQGKLIVWDKETINELTTFSKDKQTYKAEKGKHDDFAMNLVLFAWLTDSEYFKDITGSNIIMNMAELNQADLEASLLPFGFQVDQPVYSAHGVSPWTKIDNLNIPFSPFVGNGWTDPVNPEVIRMANF